MLQDIAEAIKLREEKVACVGHTFTVREMSVAADTGASNDTPKDDFLYHMMVACVFLEDGVTPALELKDIPEIKGGSRRALSPLILAVQRVNGFDVEGDEKKSEAGPG